MQYIHTTHAVQSLKMDVQAALDMFYEGGSIELNTPADDSDSEGAEDVFDPEPANRESLVRQFSRFFWLMTRGRGGW